MGKRRGGASASDEIGLARLYDFKAQSGSFVNATTQYEVRLFDIKTFTDILVSTAITSLSAGDHIQGGRSGATGYVHKDLTSATSVKLNDVNGEFLKDESILINGVQDGRIITKVDDFTFNDVKSFKSAVGVSTFEADLVLGNITRLSNFTSGNFRLSNTSGNAGIITAAGQNFAGIVTSNNIVSYTVPGETVPRFNRITGVSTDGDTINVVGVTSVTGVCNGGVSDGLIPGSIDVSDISLLSPEFNAGNNTLTTPVSRANLESLDVTNTTIQLRKQFSDITVANNQFTSPNAGANLFFQPFDEERYFISYDDGSVEPLKSSQITISADKKTVTFVGLSKTSGKANLFATVLKSKVKTKLKKLNEANVLIVNRSVEAASGIGTNSLNDGLTSSSVFGTRVQDSKISLNVPDACQLLAVIESNDAGDPDLPALTLTAYDGPSGNNSDLIIGEKVTGLASNAVGLVVEKPNVTTLGIVLLNQNTFDIGEKVKLEKSGVTASVTATTSGDRNVTNQFELDANIKQTYYDFSFIQRKRGFEAPTNRLKIIFKNFFVTSDDVGDFYTASSYPSGSEKLIPFDQNTERFVSDLVDIRPRVAGYNVSSTISPFHFGSRSFASQENNIPDPFVPDENLVVSYDYYLPRIDKLFVSKNGQFEYVQGVPSDDPKAPQQIADAIEVAIIGLPAFTREISEVKITRTSHKRFRMSDIGRLEKRLEQVEYYTALSLLEQDTSNLQITDANGLNRFKCGFFVDNFKKHEAHQIGHPDFSASIDAENGYLRPSHYTTCLDLIVGSKSFIGIGTTANPTLDINFLNDIDGENIRKTGRVLTLDYTETDHIKQIYASRTENLNPYLIVYYAGEMKINPDSDTWIDTKKVDARIIEKNEEYDAAVKKFGINVQTGFSEVDWGAWQTDHVGRTVHANRTEMVRRVPPRNYQNSHVFEVHNFFGRASRGPHRLPVKFVGHGHESRRSAIISEVKYTDITTTTHQSREGVQYKVEPKVTTEVIGSKTLSRDIVPYMRRRNIEIITHRMKPRTRFYVYFDDIDMTNFTSPKLLEVNMTSGVFQTGETVKSSNNKFVFRLAAPNHKEGPYNAPTKVITANPYQSAAGISTVYSTSSTILNIDTFSLQAQVQGSFFGHAKKNLKLIGQTSGAEATISDVRLISDSIGQLTACYEVPDPNVDANPRFETGTKTLRLTTSPTNSKIGGAVTGSAEANFQASGVVETVQDTILSTKVPIISRLTPQDQRVINDRITRKTQKDVFLEIERFDPNDDPLAQTFSVDEQSGIFATSVDVFFRTKDEELPVTVQLRTVETGLPTSVKLPFGIQTIDPDQINISEDASVPTRITFDSPVYLQGESRYALVLISASENYNVWISRMGETDISTVGLPDEQQVIISQQPYLGSLFKSQNGVTWDPSQFEDLKFTINKAVFNTSPGVGRFFSPELKEGNDQIITLPENPIKSLSRKAIIGLSTALSTTPAAGLVPGVAIGQFDNLNVSANLITTAGIATINGSNDVTIVNPGAGYTPSNAVFTYSDVPMITQTGEGTGIIGNVTVNNGVIGVVTFTNGGKNYAVGDTLGIGTLGLGNGSGAVLSVGLITATNSLVVDNIQGSFVTGIGTLGFNNGSTLIGIDGKTVGSGSTISSIDIDQTNDGLHFKVDHRAHGLHAFNNLVTINGVDSDIPSTKLTADYDTTALTDIPVISSSNFATFEGVGVGTTNFGYAILGNEIISYTGVADGSITGITTRGIDNTVKSSHSSGEEIKKYEFSGVSLRRINKTHDMNSPAATVVDPKDLDFYHIKVDMNNDGEDRDSGTLPNRFFSTTKRGGGLNVTASQNVQFETLTPNVQHITPNETSIGARVRTISATSIDGEEQSFVDQGFESITIDDQNHFETPRMIASKVNEDRQLSDLPGNKSMTFEVLMNSSNPNVSPVIDLDRVSTVLTTNRINSPVSNFASDPLVNQTGQDPCAASYVSNLVELENPSTSITVQFASYRRSQSDIRVFFKTITEGSTENSMERDFELFPGFDNTVLDQSGAINKSSFNGKPDNNVPASIDVNDFKDYEFTIEALPPFTKFQIKIDMVGTNQAQPPFIKELRAIALA